MSDWTSGFPRNQGANRLNNYLGGGSGSASLTIQDEGVPVGTVGGITSINFVGAGVTATGVGPAATVNVSAGGGSVTNVTAGTGLNVGAGPGGSITTTGTLNLSNVGTPGTYGSATQVPVTTTDAQGRVTAVVNTPITFPAATITTQDEGVPLSATVNTINFVGAGVTASGGGATTTVTIPGGGGGTVTSVTASTGITCTPNPIVGAGTVGISNTTVTAGTYGAQTQANQYTVNAQGQMTAASDFPRFASITTAAGTSTLTSASALNQFLVGATTQTVVLPVVATLFNGFEFRIVNDSTGAVTVQSSGGNVITTLAAAVGGVNRGGWGYFTCKDTAGGTGTAPWSYQAGSTAL